MNRRLIAILLSITVHGRVCAQVDMDSIYNSCHSFVNYELNMFTGDLQSPIMDNYYMQFDQMMRSSKGQLNIVHFGGSHIQVDIWSNLLRERLQLIDTNIQGARGVVFPYKAAETNRPYSYEVTWTGQWHGFRSAYNKHESTWGVTGITATTSDTLATLKFTFHGSPIHVKTSRFTLMSNISATDYKLEVVPASMVSSVTRFGDSLKHIIVEFSEPLDSFEIAFRKPSSSKAELQFYGLISENDNPGMVYHSIGVNGSRFVSYKRCNLFEDQLALLSPDLVIMSIGTNDSSEPDYTEDSYKSDYRSFLQMIRRVNPRCAFILTVPNDNYIKRKDHNDNLPSTRKVIYELAHEFDARVWDLYGIMGEGGSAEVWRDSGMMKPDLVHFTNTGYLLKGDLFYKAFMEDYLRWYNNLHPIWNE